MENTQAKPRWSNRAKALIVGGCVAAVAVSGAYAYFTDTDTVSNNFSVASALDIDVVEPSWDDATDTDGDGTPDFAENLVPTQAVSKDPKVVNNAGAEAYAIIQVSVPMANVKTIGADGSVQAAQNQELFEYTVNSGWTEYGQGTVSADGKFKVHTYIANNTVAVGASTGTLFDEVKLINLADDQFSGDTHIDVTGIGIQKEGFANGTEAWEAYQKQNA